MRPAAETRAHRGGLRHRLALAGLLVAAVAPSALAPAGASASSKVTIDSSSHDVTARVGPGGDVRVNSALSFSEDISFGGPPPAATARAAQTSALTDSPGGISVVSSADLSASGGTTEEHSSGQARLGHELTVLAPVAFRVSGTISGTLATSAVSLRLIPNFEGATGFEFDAGDGGGPVAAEGTLAPGSWLLSYEATAVSPCSGTCAAAWDVTLDLDEPAPAVAIGSGPSGVVASRNAHFEFTTTNPSPPAGVYECRVDGAGSTGFSTCTSPHDVTGLSDGQHRFDVRYHPNGADPSASTGRTWTVDTTAPAVVFDAAPSGTTNPPSAQIEFHSSEPDGATFRCRLDSGPEVDCSSPHALTSLATGPHSFSVTTTDKAGNTSPAASVAWTVSAAAPAAVVTCDPGRVSVGFGAVRAIAVQANACFFDATIDGRPAQVSTGQVMLNGITLTPAPGTRIIVSSRLGDGTVRTDGPVTLVFGRPPGPGEDPIDVTLPLLDLSNLGTSVSGVTKAISFAEGILEVAGLKAAPGLGLELAADDGGQLKVTFRVTLPTVAFKRLPGSPEGVTVEFTPTFSNDKGVTVGGRIKLATVYLFGRKVTDLDLAYDHGSGLFEGSFGIALGEALPGRAEPTFTASITIGPSTSPCQLRKIGLQQSNLNRHIGRGVFLQRYGGTFECVSEGGDLLLKLAGNGGVSAGPRIAIGSFETEAISIDGTATLSLPITGGDFSFEIEGIGKVVEFPVTQQKITYKPPATVGLTGTLDLTIGGYGGVFTYGQSFVSPTAFNIEATGTAQISGFVTAAEAVFSSTGFAVCAGPAGLRVGFGRAWGASLQGFSGVCDVGPFRTAATARAAQGGVHRFTVGAERPLTVLAAKGRGAPPKVVVAGPGGVKVQTPAGPQALSTKDVIVVQDDGADTTFVVLRRPAAGDWSISTVDGSSVLAGVRLARGLPPLRLTAKVSGRGSRRVLDWKATGLGGQRLQFVERSGRAAALLTTTRKSSGRLRFTPDPALGANRTIQAVSFNGATPRSTQTAARYRVAAPRRPRRTTGLKLRKRVLTWRAQPGITRYELALTRPDGTQTSHVARRARLPLAGLPKKGTLRVAIVAVNGQGRTGPIATARFKLG